MVFAPGSYAHDLQERIVAADTAAELVGLAVDHAQLLALDLGEGWTIAQALGARALEIDAQYAVARS